MPYNKILIYTNRWALALVQMASPPFKNEVYGEFKVEDRLTACECVTYQ